MPNYRYPHTHFSEDDLSELIRMYKELTGKYSSILGKLKIAEEAYDRAVEEVKQQATRSENFIRQENDKLQNMLKDENAKLVQNYENNIARAEEIWHRTIHYAEHMWKKSVKYVNDWNRKWATQVDLMRSEYLAYTSEIQKMQERMIQVFERKITQVINSQQELNKRFRELTEQNIIDVNDLLSTALRDMSEMQNAFRETLTEDIETWTGELAVGLDKLNDNIRDNLYSFKVFVNEKMQLIQSKLDDMYRGVTDYTVYVDNLVKNAEQYVDNSMTAYDEKFDRRTEDIKADHDEDMKAVFRFISELTETLRKEIEEARNFRVEIQVDDILVISPVTETLKRLQWTLDEMWHGMRFWAITAGEMDAAKVKVWWFEYFKFDPETLPDKEGLTCQELDYQGKWYLIERRELLRKWRRSLRRGIKYAMVWAMPAGIFDELKITAGELDNWSWRGKTGIPAIDVDRLLRWIIEERPSVVAEARS